MPELKVCALQLDSIHGSRFRAPGDIERCKDIWGLGFMVQGLGFRVQTPNPSGCRIWEVGLQAWGHTTIVIVTVIVIVILMVMVIVYP